MAEENAALALAEPSPVAGQPARRPCWTSSSARSACPSRPTASRRYDISTFQGGETVASMVVWEDGDMKKDDYKRYRIRTVDGRRRLRRHARGGEPALRTRRLETEGVLPDLILLDGGRGQLSAGSKALGGPRPRLPAHGLAGQARRGGVHARPPRSRSCSTRPRPRCRRSRRSATRRTASPSRITRSSRSRRTISSVLDADPGVGPTLRTSLLKTLGSATAGARGLASASSPPCPRSRPRLAAAHPRLLPSRRAGGGTAPERTPG